MLYIYAYHGNGVLHVTGMCVGVGVGVCVCVCVCMCVCVCVWCVYVCVCPPLRLLITSCVMWRDMDPIRLVKQVLQLLYGNCTHYH